MMELIIGIIIAAAIGFYVGKAVTRRKFRQEQDAQELGKGGGGNGPDFV